MTAPVVRRRPPGRYDEPSLLFGRVLAVVLGALFLGLVVAVAYTLYLRYGAEAVRERVLGYEVESDRAVSVRFEVAAPPGEPVTCVVRARDRAGAEVGRDLVEVGSVSPGERVLQVTHRLRTTARPVTGEVQRCGLTADLRRSAP